MPPLTQRGQNPRGLPWPGRLRQTRGLHLSRGDVILLKRTLYVIVAFDGREDGYLCWGTVAESDVFDFTQTIFVPLDQAHMAERCVEAELPEFPELPAVDHIGRLDTGSRAPRRRGFSPPAASEIPSICLDAAEPQRSVSSTSPCCVSPRRDFPSPEASESSTSRSDALPAMWNVPVAVREFPSWSSDSQRSGSGPPSEVVSPRAVGASPVTIARSSTLDLVPASTPNGRLPLGEQDVAQCAICTVIRSVADPFHSICSWVKTLPERARLSSPLSAERGPASTAAAPSRWIPRPATDQINYQQYSSPSSSSTGRVGSDEMRITIPIVRPPSWQEVQPLAHRMPVTFDERGVKETMTVKMDRWESFVDRQKQKLEKEVQEMQEALAAERGREREREGAEESSTKHAAEHWELEEPETKHEPPDSDLVELLRMLDRMDDWKDLSRYSGKSISMGSTQRGNEMKIHVMAFAEREDGSGVDFMRLSYRKSVEVREAISPMESTPGIGSILRNFLPFSASDAGRGTAEERWIELLQQPDIAKFTIALAFRRALENDGIHLQFCDARLDDR